jgi:hypothetical protein
MVAVACTRHIPAAFGLIRHHVDSVRPDVATQIRNIIGQDRRYVRLCMPTPEKAVNESHDPSLAASPHAVDRPID